ncbi:MAG TPA: immunoglobulin domain-containing protein, partial [Methylomirabilota bacterium]|nr:immunoglobulin domain-containing protein [Methylomirabilota bacterium]
MKRSRSRMGLSIIAGGLSFVGSAHATDIVIDGSYESATNNMVTTKIGNGGNDTAGLDGGWTHFSTYNYAANYTQAGPAGAGLVYLRPYNSSGGSMTVTQTNTLTRAITTADIDSSQGQFNASAWFSTYHGDNDYSDLTLLFLDGSFSQVGSPVALGGAAFVAALAGSPGNRAWGKDTKIGLVPPGARYASITTVSHSLSGQPDGYVDLVKLDVTAGVVPVQASSTPANGASNVSPGIVIQTIFTDGTTPLNTNSIQFKFDGSAATPVITRNGATVTLQYDPPGLLASFSAHTYQVAFNSSGGATANTTNQFAFTVAPYANINLGAPIVLENFDSLQERHLPVQWSVTNATDANVAGLDLNDVLSDAYLDWVVISRTRLISNLMSTNGDFFGVTNVAPNQVINGSVVTNLVSGNFIIAVSDRADNQKQIQVLFTKDYSLTGKTNVYLSFHNLYTQNQDSMGSIEYSINGGTTWLPALYLLDGPDILRGANGNIDASNTFAIAHGDVPNVDASSLANGHYGQYIGVGSNQWAGLAPFIGARIDDDQTDGQRVEVIRLAQADNQPNVRFRFGQVGTWSWYFGMDDFGLYSLTNQGAPVLVSSPSPATLTVAAGNQATFTIGTALGLGPITYQWRRNGTNLVGQTSQQLTLSNVRTSDAGSYDVVVSNGGGSVTSLPPASVVTVINPSVYVTGQWDFRSNLVATCGTDLQYFDDAVSNSTSFATTFDFGISDINGQPTTVMHLLPPVASQWGGFKLFPNTGPNGGGTNINQYTLIYDILYPVSAWRSLWQTDPSNNTDGEVFVDPSDAIGISQIYDGSVSAGNWHRIAIAFDLSGPGQAPVLTKFIDGVKVGNQTDGLSPVDDRFSVKGFGLLFADNDGDTAEAYVSSVQFSNGRRPDAFLAAL